MRRSGRQRLYRLNAERLEPIHDWVKSFERFWDESFDRLDKYLHEIGKVDLITAEEEEILAQKIREGDQVNAGQPFLTIVDPRSMVLNATVNQVDAERLRLGMKAAVRLDAYPEVELPGSLLGIAQSSLSASAFLLSLAALSPVVVGLVAASAVPMLYAQLSLARGRAGITDPARLSLRPTNND